ncbi:hypothetical protein JQX13_14425 [Archangium violaceum]|uniref:hypothetical protein n=1 Tax=Archangium violaceum TaxID=83451 RepID=UPI00193BB2DE|nr:hypothetical protein [Archangium violaceum]QRK11157.1 hypothetical protein JQX13_14425 [Archangium violaceum]
MADDKKKQEKKGEEKTVLKATPSEGSKEGLQFETGTPMQVVLLTRKRKFLFSQ